MPVTNEGLGWDSSTKKCFILHGAYDCILGPWKLLQAFWYLGFYQPQQPRSSWDCRPSWCVVTSVPCLELFLLRFAQAECRLQKWMNKNMITLIRVTEGSTFSPRVSFDKKHTEWSPHMGKKKKHENLQEKSSNDSFFCWVRRHQPCCKVAKMSLSFLRCFVPTISVPTLFRLGWNHLPIKTLSRGRRSSRLEMRYSPWKIPPAFWRWLETRCGAKKTPKKSRTQVVHWLYIKGEKTYLVGGFNQSEKY